VGGHDGPGTTSGVGAPGGYGGAGTGSLNWGQPPVYAYNPPPWGRGPDGGFTASLPGDFGGAFGVSGACGADLTILQPSFYASPVDNIEAVTQQTERYVEQCGCATKDCIADALDKYADALEKAVEPPPPEFRPFGQQARPVPHVVRELPRIVREAAKKVRAAPTVKAAVKALSVAVTVVRKTIALLRATDPDSTAVATRGGDLVSETLKTAATSLERAETL